MIRDTKTVDGDPEEDAAKTTPADEVPEDELDTFVDEENVVVVLNGTVKPSTDISWRDSLKQVKTDRRGLDQIA